MTRGPKPHPPQPPVSLPGTLQHGTHRAYTYYGCRCLPCQTKRREYAKQAAQSRLRQKVPTTATHGTVSTYVYWGCRCEACCEARRSYDREAWETGRRQERRNEQRRMQAEEEES